MLPSARQGDIPKQRGAVKRFCQLGDNQLVRLQAEARARPVEDLLAGACAHFGYSTVKSDAKSAKGTRCGRACPSLQGN